MDNVILENCASFDIPLNIFYEKLKDWLSNRENQRLSVIDHKNNHIGNFNYVHAYNYRPNKDMYKLRFSFLNLSNNWCKGEIPDIFFFESFKKMFKKTYPDINDWGFIDLRVLHHKIKRSYYIRVVAQKDSMSDFLEHQKIKPKNPFKLGTV